MGRQPHLCAGVAQRVRDRSYAARSRHPRAGRRRRPPPYAPLHQAHGHPAAASRSGLGRASPRLAWSVTSTGRPSAPASSTTESTPSLIARSSAPTCRRRPGGRAPAIARGAPASKATCERSSESPTPPRGGRRGSRRRRRSARPGPGRTPAPRRTGRCSPAGPGTRARMPRAGRRPRAPPRRSGAPRSRPGRGRWRYRRCARKFSLVARANRSLAGDRRTAHSSESVGRGRC